MKKTLINFILLLSFVSLNAQSYELYYQNMEQLKLAKWTSNSMPDLTIQYAKRDILFEPKSVNIFQQTKLIYTFEREKLNHILRNQDGEIVSLYKPFTYVLGNGTRYDRKLKRLGKSIELYNQNEVLVAKASILERQNFKRKLKIEIIKPTDDNQALLTLLAIDLLEHFRVRNNPFY
ncbi:MAG: hypothetical protein Sapg2KO_06170 [Saprospiraceae bacterium]